MRSLRAVSDRIVGLQPRPRQTLSIFLVALFLIVGAAPSVAAEQAAQIPVTIEAIPQVDGVAFVFAGERIVTDQRGIAHARVAVPGTYRLRVARFQVIGDDIRVEFSQWSEATREPRLDVSVDGATRIGAGFDVDYLVTTRFTDARGEDLDAGIVESVNVVDDSGQATTYPGEEPGLAGPTAVWWKRHPPGTRWLRGVRTVGTGPSFDTELVSYRAESVVIAGTRFPTSSEPYFPARGSQWNIEAIAYPVRLDPRGLISRLGVAPTVDLTYPNGESRDHRVPAGRAVLLPRGSYEARADALGLSPTTDFTVPGSDHVRVFAVTYADAAAAALLFGILLLVTTRLRARRGRVRDRSAEEPARASEQPAPHPAAEAPAPPEPVDDDHVEKGYVRVHLRDGRSVEGWSRRWRDSQIWFMDVTIVRNGDGIEVPSTSRDTVLLSTLIERVEKLDPEPELPDKA